MTGGSSVISDSMTHLFLLILLAPKSHKHPKHFLALAENPLKNSPNSFQTTRLILLQQVENKTVYTPF